MSEDMQQATSSTLEDVPQAALTLIPGDYYKVLYIFESTKGPIPKELIAVLESVNEDKSGGNFTFLKETSTNSKSYRVNEEDKDFIKISDIIENLPPPTYRRGVIYWEQYL